MALVSEIIADALEKMQAWYAINKDNEYIKKLQNWPSFNVKEYGAKGDGITDDTSAIQSALDTGGIIFFPRGTYRITNTVWVKYSYTKVIFEYGAKILYDGPVGGVAFKIDCGTYNGGSTYIGIQLENIFIDGNGKALWCFWANGLTTHCVVSNMYLTNGVGLLYASKCWYSTWKNIVCWACYDGVPVGLDTSTWASIHNSYSAAPISFLNANSTLIDGLIVGRVGTTNVPTGYQPTYQAICCTGANPTLRNLSFWRTGSPDILALSRLIYLNYCQVVDIRNVYIEESRFGVFMMADMYARNIQIDNIYGYNIGLDVRLFEIAKKVEVSISNVCLLNVKLNTQQPTIVHGLDGIANLQEFKNVYIQGEYNENIGGKNYTTITKGSYGLVGVNFSIAGTNIPKIVSGLTVSSSSDANGSFLLIEPGIILDDKGKVKAIGQFYTFSPNVGYVGYKIYAPTTAGTWNLCIDTFGGVFIESAASPRSSAAYGKIVLATFTTDSTGAITSITKANLTYDGIYTNNFANKIIYSNAPPTTGTWQQGDIVFNTAPVAGGKIGWVCVASGSPGTWKAFGVIDA